MLQIFDGTHLARSVAHARRLRFLRALSLATFLILIVSGAISATAAVAAPIWNLDIHHSQTNFPPDGVGEYWFDLENIGDAATSGPITLTVTLPKGLTRASAGESLGSAAGLTWSCPGSWGESVIVCTTEGVVPRRTPYLWLTVSVKVAPSASGKVTTRATVKGGGAAPASATEPTFLGDGPAGFGIVPFSFAPEATEPDGITPARDAGAHPGMFIVPIDFNSIAAPTQEAPAQKEPAETIRDLQIGLPLGFIGNPAAVGDCIPAQLSAGACPSSSQVGRVDVRTYPLFFHEVFEPISLPVFNMSAPRGSLMDLAFQISGNPVHLKASLDPSNGYGAVISGSDLNETAPLFDLKLILWGVPADHSHDSERCGDVMETTKECATGTTPRPFVTLPSRCGVDQVATLRNYDSWQHTGTYGPELTYQMPGQITACQLPRFEPRVEIEPTSDLADDPTGLDVHIELPQNENSDARATPPAKRVVVTLPPGMALSPSAVDGLSACLPVQIGLASDDPVNCPDSSRVGTVTLSTPLLPKPLEGFMYLASQRDNPFHGLLAIYLVVRDTEKRGVMLKMPGRLELDPASGQITVGFDDLPQFPFEDFTLGFRSGERAPLVNPPTCGTKTIEAEVASYAQPDDPVGLSDTYQVREAANGSPCPPSLASRPFTPRLEAGTVNPSADAFSPLVFRLSREDQDRELGGVSIDLPSGLLAKVSGIPLCPDSAIASISVVEGTGRAELDSPSCAAASEVGTATVGAGAGSLPLYLSGKVYLAGPYKGAPFSLVTVAPVVVGPLDLGTVAMRIALYVDPVTAQVRAVSDPLPTILFGIPIELRALRLNLNRSGFIRNPTSCEKMAISGVVDSSQGPAASVFSRFQVGDCASLGFRPAVVVRLVGPTHRGGHPRVLTVLTPRAGDANLRAAAVTLPATQLLDTRHIGTVCSTIRFGAGQCPVGAIYGHAKAWTPMLDQPLEGPVYLRSSHHKLPDLVASLDGQIQLDLTARVKSARGRLRITLGPLPDAPLSMVVLTMAGGRRGLLANTGGLCARRRRADASFRGQNGKRYKLHPVVKTECRKR